MRRTCKPCRRSRMSEIFSQKRKILSRYERQKALVAALRSERNPERKKFKEEISTLLALEIRLGIPCSGEFSSAVSIDEDLEQKIPPSSVCAGVPALLILKISFGKSMLILCSLFTACEERARRQCSSNP